MSVSRQRSLAALDRARASVAGGDSSAMRVLPYHPPIVAERGEGAWIVDIDGNRYLDLNMGYGPHLFGHRPAFLIERLGRALAERGPQLGFPTELNAEVAEKVRRLFPSMQRMRFANSGTEAVASAVRVARHATGRRRIVLFEGHYHGWSEAVFHRYHAPLEDLPARPGDAALPGTLGMGTDLAQHAVLCPWNDAASLAQVLDRHRGEIAAVLMEPVMGNGGTVPPRPGYLQAVRDLTRDHGCLLMFDEVITGLRVAAGGAQERFGVTPDLTVISKVLGGGVPIAAFGGSRDLMEPVARGTVFHGGVYSSNVMVLTAASAVLDRILDEADTLYPRLEATAAALARGFATIFEAHQVAHCVQHVGAVLSVFLTRDRVEHLHDYRAVRRHGDFERYIRLEHALAERGVYLHPNMFEPLFPSLAHGPEEIDFALNRVEDGVRGCLRIH